MEEELKVIQLILTGSGSFSIAIAVSLLLLKRILNGLAADIARVERYLEEYRKNCDLRQEKNTLEYEQILKSLNEIKVQLTRTETVTQCHQDMLM